MLLGLKKNKRAAKSGGTAAGAARKAFEKETGKKVSSKTNYLCLSEKDHRKLIGNVIGTDTKDKE